MRRFSATTFAAGVLCVATVANAAPPQVSIETKLEQDTVAMDQVLQMTVSVTVHGDGSIDQIELPHAPALQVIGTSKSEQSSFVMGRGGIDSSHTTVHHLTFKPLKTGDVQLTAAQVVSGGRAYKGNAVHVKIVAAGQGPAPRRQQQQNPFGNFFGQQSLPPGFGNFPPMPGFNGGDDDEDDPFAQLFGSGRAPAGEDVILGASVDKRKVVLGQQVTYIVRLYTRADVSEFSELKLPGFDGFWGEDLETPTRPVPKLQTLGGVQYQVYLIKKKALFPDKAGTLTIAPSEIDVSVGLGFFRGRKIHRESPSLTVEVAPLPAGAPVDFSATNVGTWSFSARLSPASLPVGEPATLSLIVEGVGNLRGLVLPQLPAISGLRTYDPTSNDKPSAQGDRFGGRRQVDIMLIPQRTGDFEVPPLTFRWFDPQTGFQSTTTPKLSLKAVVGKNSPNVVAGGPAGQNVLESSFRPLREEGDMLRICGFRSRQLPAPLSGWPLAAGFGVPPLVLAAGALARSIRRRRAAAAPSIRGRRAYRVARQKLDGKAGSALGVSEVSQALFGYLADRLGEQVTGLSFPALRDRLIARGFQETTVRSTLGAFELAESLRYMPTGSTQERELGKLRSMAEFALEALERESPKGPKAREVAA